MSTTSQMQKGRDSGKCATPTTSANDTALVHLRGGELVTDSLTIAREFGRSHKHVLRTLDSLIADGTVGRPNFEPTSYTDEWNREQRMVELDERGALIALPFIGGRNSRKGQARLVDAFLMLREQAARQQSPEWAVSRKQVAASYRFMSQSLEMTRADDGKSTQGHHFANEAKLLNWILTGRFESLERDALSAADLALLEALEARNAVLIARGTSYPERKAVLPTFARAWLAKHPAASAGSLLGGVQ